MCVIACFSILLAQKQRRESQAGFIQSHVHADAGPSLSHLYHRLSDPGAGTYSRPSTGARWAPLRAQKGPSFAGCEKVV